ncbi:hypothetical protein ACQKDS_17910 [Serratia sp. NPDC078593]|uniref:hypothetical protein n=1 Tax=unclassified Serratia (in: enterobacteria) TaxID=2647522 RepID=UPI0037D034CB
MVSQYRANHFSCRGSVHYFKDDAQFTAHLKFMFNGGKGEVSSLGEFLEQGEKSQKISQSLKFNYTRTGDDMFLISTQSTLPDSLAKIMTNLVPDFYLYPDRGLRIHIYRQGNKGYVFMVDNIPSFICAKI